MNRDLYEVLGVARDATEATIKKAYRKLSMKHHPDRDSGSKEAFQEIEQAYRILSDPVAKGHYDSTGEIGDSAQNSLMNEVTSLFMNVIDKVEDVDRVDLVKVAVDAVQAAMKAMKSQKAGIQRIVDKQKRAAKRIRRKSGENWLVKKIEMLIAAQEQELLRADASLAHNEKLLELVREFEYQHEPPVKLRINPYEGPQAGMFRGGPWS